MVKQGVMARQKDRVARPDAYSCNLIARRQRQEDHVFKARAGGGGRRWLSGCAGLLLSRGQSLDPSTHIGWFTSGTLTSAARDLILSSGFHGHLNTHKLIYRDINKD